MRLITEKRGWAGQGNRVYLQAIGGSIFRLLTFRK